jgi:hypothetical protein
MTTILDLVNLLLDCISSFRRASLGSFTLSFAVASILSAVCWFVCTKWTLLWNKRFHARPLHHCFCGVASTLTFVFVVAFASLPFLKPVADLVVQRWSAMLASQAGGDGGSPANRTLSDTERQRAEQWLSETSLKARHEVFVANKSGLESRRPFTTSEWRDICYLDTQQAVLLRDMAARNGWSLDADELHTREKGSARIPLGGKLTEIAAEIYAGESIALFQNVNPFLSKIVWPPSEKISRNLIVDDTALFFSRQTDNAPYPLSRAIEIARKEVYRKLAERTLRVVTIGRWVLFGLFLCAQAIPFGMVGWAAYRDLKVFRSAGLPRSRPAASSTAARHRSVSRRR